MSIFKRAAILFPLALMCAVGVSVEAQHGRRRVGRLNPTRGLSSVARQEAARIASIPNDDKAKVLKAAEDLRFLLRMEQKGDYESIYFWAGFDCLERKHGDDWSEVEQVTKLILREGQVAKLMDETAYILRNARELVDYKASPYDIAPSLGISDRISRDDLERHMLASAEQKIANIFKILKAAGMTEN